MTGRELYERFNIGTEIIVRFTALVNDIETQFENGMLGRIQNVELNEDDGLIDVVINEKGFSEQNKILETPVWSNLITEENHLKYSDVHNRQEAVEISDSLDEELCFMEVLSNSGLVKEYAESETEKPYVQWLEETVMNLRKSYNDIFSKQD